MSFTQYETGSLRECLKEIIDENYFSTIHELKKKLAASAAKQQEIVSKVTQYAEEIERLKDCHKCHTLLVEHQDAYTQTIEVESDDEPDPVSPNLRGIDGDKDIQMNSNGLERSQMGETTTTSEKQGQSTSYQQEPSVEPKMECQAEEPNPLAGNSNSNANNVSSSVELICISDED